MAPFGRMDRENIGMRYAFARQSRRPPKLRQYRANEVLTRRPHHLSVRHGNNCTPCEGAATRRGLPTTCLSRGHRTRPLLDNHTPL
jgi:hypothetical protein